MWEELRRTVYPFDEGGRTALAEEPRLPSGARQRTQIDGS